MGRRGGQLAVSSHLGEQVLRLLFDPLDCVGPPSQQALQFLASWATSVIPPVEAHAEHPA